MPDEHEARMQAPTSFVTYRMTRAQNKLNAQASHLLRRHSDLSVVEWRVVQLLGTSDGASMTELAQGVGMDKGQLSRKISAMVEKGLLYTSPDEDDSRKHHLHLSQTAIEISKRLMPIMRKRQALLVAGISDADLAIFFEVLARIDAASETREVE